MFISGEGLMADDTTAVDGHVEECTQSTEGPVLLALFITIHSLKN
jgi:hypothetical protein